jgi:N-acetylglucosaminyl-diphospho-decaprenol L-rhamnosyltransferase
MWGAVVVNYESGEDLLRCVDSLLADTSAGVPDVVVVDNGSRDGSVARLRATRPEVAVVEAGGNLGYAAAANLGIAHTDRPVVAVCNADLVVTPGTAAALLARFDAEPDVAAVGPAVVNPDGSYYPSARSEPAIGTAVGHALFGVFRPENRFSRRYRQLGADPTLPRDVDWLSGAAIWLRRGALQSVGGWDDGYFMYMEDLDLCWRLRRLGWRVVYEPAGRVVHEQGASTSAHPYRMIVAHHRSVYRFTDKRWRGAKRMLLPVAAAFLAARALGAIVLTAAGTRPGRPRVTG